MRTSIPSTDPISWACRSLPATIVFGLLLVLGFAPSGFAQSVDGPLTFENNFFVTGDYVVAGAQGLNTNWSNGMTTGTITIPDTNPGIQPGSTANCTILVKGKPTAATNCVPAGAEILGALLYWQTVEKTGAVPGSSGSGQNGFFGPKGGTAYPISGVDLMSQSSVAFSSGGCSGGSTGKVVRTYRASVIGYLPQDPATGAVIPNASYQVTLPSVGSSTPLTLGATLVIIYRILSPNVPLNSIVIYDGAYGQSTAMLTMQQTMQGFYQPAQNPVARLTHIVGSGQSNKYQTVYLGTTSTPLAALPSLYGKNAPAFPGYYGGSSGYGWDNPTWTFPTGTPFHFNDSYATTKVVPSSSNQGCVTWGAVIVSTTVQNTSGDGLLDKWKTDQGYCDASVNEGHCNGSGDPAWVSLVDANDPPEVGHKDVFVQLDYMCSKVTGPGLCNTTPPNYSFDPGPANGPVLAPVVTAFSHQGVHLHIVPGNSIQEQKCIDNDPNTTSPALCPYPNQPGVIGWKGGLVFIQNQLINPSTGLLYPPGTDGYGPVLQSAKKDSYHYALFAHAIGLPNWSLGAGNLTSVVQQGSTVKFTTSTPHGLTAIQNCANNNNGLGRVTVAFAISNFNLDGTFCVQSATANTFTITVGNSRNATYTFNTDPDLEVGSGQAGSVSGFSDVGGQDSLITLGNWGLDATPTVKTGTFMHELGHSLGLTHGGFYYNTAGSYVPTIGQNCKSNYQSVMNYMFQIDLLDPGNGQNVPDYSGQTLANISKSAGGSNPFTDPIAPYLTSWHGTSAQVGVPASTTPLSLYCDGTPFPGANPGVYRVTRPASLLTWVASQDINFDGVINDPTFVGYDDWTSTATTTGVDMRQIGATGSLSAAGLVGGGKQFGAGGGKQFGAGGGQQFGAGGGKQFGAGGGKQFGAGGGKQFGAGGGLGDLTQSIANSFTRPPRGLTATEDASARLIHLSWSIPTFGQIGAYRIYRSTNGGASFSLLTTVAGGQLMYTDTVSCNATGYQYYVTAVLAGTFPVFPPLANQGQESVPSNVASIGSDGKLTGCYLVSSISLPINPDVQGSLVPITWTLTDDFNTVGAGVTNKTANTLVAIGPVPGTCAMGQTTILSSGTPQSGASTFTSSNSGLFTFDWDTDAFCAGSYTFRLILDSTQTQTSAGLVLQIDVTDRDTTPHITTVAVPNGVVGTSYSNTISEEGGVTGNHPFTWALATGSNPLPVGLSLGTAPDGVSGLLSGTPCVTPGTYTFTVQVTDAQGNQGAQILSLNLSAAPVAQLNQPTAPESSVPGGPSISALALNGTGFNACSKVQWNGGAVTTAFVSATKLTATIPNTDVASAGTASISVANIGSPTSNVDFFQITNSTAGNVFLHQAGTATSVGVSPIGVISADLDGDGNQDVAVANSGSGTVAIVLGNGDGTFKPAVTYPVGSGPYSLIAGDFNNDGNLDLAVVNSTDGTLSILLGDGHGVFSTTSTPAVGHGPFSVVTGDFNGDGKLDLAVANVQDHSVSILLGNGDGTFQTHADYPGITSGSGTLDVGDLAVGDFNGDGKLDLAVTNPGTDQVSILLGNGDGTFQAPVSYSTGAPNSHPIAVAVADFNNNGKLDLAVTNLNTSTVAILLGNGDGTFTLNNSYSTTTGMMGPSAITTGDFDGDGNIDLAITDQLDNSVSILVGGGDGTFQSPVTFKTGTNSNTVAGVAAGDFNGDGRLDVAVANNFNGNVSIMLQAPHVKLTPSPSLPSFGSVAVSGSSAPQVVTLTNDGSAALSITGVTFTGTNLGDFSQTNNCPTSPNTLAAGSNCTINVTFKPAQAGALSASLSITDNAPLSPQSVGVSGTGILAPPTNLTATATAGSGLVSLNWTASTSGTVTGYNVYRGIATGGPYALIASAVAGTSYPDNVASGTYFYVVTAVDAGANESANSNEANATD